MVDTSSKLLPNNSNNKLYFFNLYSTIKSYHELRSNFSLLLELIKIPKEK